MRAEIWMGSSAVFELDVKRIEVSEDGIFMRITDTSGDVFEVSPHNVILIHDKKYEEEE